MKLIEFIGLIFDEHSIIIVYLMVFKDYIADAIIIFLYLKHSKRLFKGLTYINYAFLTCINCILYMNFISLFGIFAQCAAGKKLDFLL